MRTCTRKGRSFAATRTAAAAVVGLLLCAGLNADPVTDDRHDSDHSPPIDSYPPDFWVIDDYQELWRDTTVVGVIVTSTGELNTRGYTLYVEGPLTNHGRITDFYSQYHGGGGFGGSGGNGGYGGYGGFPHYPPCCATEGSIGQGRGGAGGGGGGGGGGAWDTSAPIEGTVDGGDGGDGGNGGDGGGHVRLYAFSFDNQNVIKADGDNGDPGQNGGDGSYGDWFKFLAWRDAASGGGGGGGGGDGGDGGIIEIHCVELINEGDIHASAGLRGLGGDAGASFCANLEHSGKLSQNWEHGGPGQPGGGPCGWAGNGGESDIGTQCGPNQAEDGQPGCDGEPGTVLLIKSCRGDIDGDEDTDQGDLGLLLAAYGACVGDPNWNSDADLNASGCVDQADLGILLADYGCAPRPWHD